MRLLFAELVEMGVRNKEICCARSRRTCSSLFIACTMGLSLVRHGSVDGSQFAGITEAFGALIGGRRRW